MPRHHGNWIEAFMDYSQYSEAPRHMHFWTAVSTVAGALQRRVWFDQGFFKWFPNFYIALVAPPGVVSKSTTASIGMSLLRKVPGITFGPDIVTWPSLVKSISDCTVGFQVGDMIHTMSPIQLESSEFGNLIDPKDGQMMNVLIDLWDGRGSLRKETKTSGSEEIENPWINIIACTTPSWIAQAFPEVAIGGGFTSRIIFVYADKKAKLMAYPKLMMPERSWLESRAERLVADLTQIAKLAGEFTITKDAYDWGKAWYDEHNNKGHATLDRERFVGYLSRKQGHTHKLAMVLAASRGDELVITLDDLQLADTMVTDLEQDLPLVFSKIGQTSESVYLEKLITAIHVRGAVPFADAYRLVHTYFPSLKDFEDMIFGAIRAGYLDMKGTGNSTMLCKGPAELPSQATDAKHTGINGKFHPAAIPKPKPGSVKERGLSDEK